MYPGTAHLLLRNIANLLLVAGVLMFSQNLPAPAQEPPKQETPKQEPGKYTAEEYKAFQAITAEADPAKKADLLVKFIQERPQSALRQNVVADYYGMLQKLQGEEKWTELVSAGERFLTVVPDDELTVSALAAGYQKTKDQKKFVVFAEKVFAKKPEGTTAYYLTQAYKDLKNDAKYIEWGEKTVSLMPDNHEILLELTKKFGEAKKNAQAAKYARQTIKALQSTSKPEGATDKQWKDYTTHAYATCYNVIGNVAYEQQDYGTAITNLENTLKYYNKNDLAYYNLAHSYWQKGQVDLAMKNFAKTYILKTPRSAAAKQHLDNLYRSTHQNTLTGVERVIAKAQEELK
jgi:Tetratricopeptide repeat